MSKRVWILSSAVAVLIAALLATSAVLLKRPPSTGSLASVDFENGTRLAILDAAVATSLDINPPENFFSGWFFRDSTGTKTTGWGALDADVRRRRENGSWAGTSLMTDQEALMLVVAARDVASGTPVPSESLWGAEGGALQIVFDGDGALDDVMSETELASRIPEPLWRIEIEDSAGGWHRMMGPLVPEFNEARAFYWLPMFPRDVPSLQLRLTRHGGESQTVTLTNPGFAAAASSWTLDPVPVTLPMGEFMLKAEPYLEDDGTGSHYPGLSTSIVPMASHQSKKSWKLDPVVFSDEFGNIGQPGTFRFFPPASLVRCNITARRSKSYSWPSTRSPSSRKSPSRQSWIFLIPRPSRRSPWRLPPRGNPSAYKLRSSC